MNESNDTFKSFSTTNATNFGKEFLESNTLVAKFAFLLVALIGFLLLLRVCLNLITWLSKPSASPHLIDGMVDASQLIVFPQDPSQSDAVTIYRSVDASQGLEFTWSVWIYINKLQSTQNTYKHIFSKGNSTLDDKGLVTPNNAPGLYITPYTNTLLVVMNTFNVINEEILIPDIPMNKWVNIIVRCQNKELDVYINGTITRSLTLLCVPKQNYGEVYVGLNGGFDGNISNLWYYNYALGTSAIQRIATKGPNTKIVDGSMSTAQSNYDYLSLRWFFR